MKKLLVAFGFAFALAAAAEARADVLFPIAELGGCTSESSCHSYCDLPANTERCLEFAEENELMSDREIAEARNFLKIGSGPGGCGAKDECESYCDDVSHIRECIAFAEKHDLMSGEELKEAKQIIRALDSGATLPGGCTNEESCDAYCNDDANILECVTFAEAAGFITSEEASMVKKTGGRGPGGCRRDECESYCEDPRNAEACYNFAKEYGLMDPEMEKGSDEFLNTLRNAPQEVKLCMESAFGDVDKIFPGPATGAKLQECLGAFRQANPEGAYWPAQPQEQRTGPGGCKNREECDAYCLANPIECRPDDDRSAPPQGGPSEFPSEDDARPIPPTEEPGSEPVTYSAEAGLASILWIFQQLIAR